MDKLLNRIYSLQPVKTQLIQQQKPFCWKGAQVWKISGGIQSQVIIEELSNSWQEDGIENLISILKKNNKMFTTIIKHDPIALYSKGLAWYLFSGTIHLDLGDLALKGESPWLSFKILLSSKAKKDDLRKIWPSQHLHT